MKSANSNLPDAGNKIFSRRRALHLPQGELAARCQISRQFLSLLEAGRTQPNVQLALRLAEELGTTVEQLFGGSARVDTPAGGLAIDLPQATLPAGVRLELGRIQGRWVGHPADSVWSLGGGFSPADAVLAWHDGAARAVIHRPIAELENNLLIAGCDPALGLLRGRSEGAVPGRFVWINCGSARALDLLAAGQAHVAGLHYGGAAIAENLRHVTARDPLGHWVMVRFTRWENGWIVRPAVRPDFTGTDVLGGGRLRLANRERGAGSRQWLDRTLKKARVPSAGIAGYDRELPNHWECARALTEDRADVAVGPRAIAAAFGLDFVAVEEVAFDLVLPRALLDHPRVQLLLNRLRSRGFQSELEMLPGYAANEAGDLVARA